MAKDTDKATEGDRAPGIGDNSELTNEEFLQLAHQHAVLKRREDEAKAARKAYRKTMRARGVVLGDLDAAVRMTEWSREDIDAQFTTRLQYLKWLRVPVGFQFSLFDQPDPASQDDDARTAELVANAETNGWQFAIMGGDEKDNPHEANAPAGQAWIKGYRNGAAFVKRAGGKNKIN